MAFKFVLTVTIEGDSLDEIDNQLAAAAGQRLMARLERKPTFNGKVPTMKVEKKETVDSAPKSPESAPQTAPAAETSAKPSKELPPHARALKVVYDRLGKAAAEECLSKFGVSKVHQLKGDQIDSFVQYVNSKLEVKDGAQARADQ